MNSQIKAEIVELHLFFQNWFNGVLANNPSEFARFETVLSPEFTMVTPGGVLIQCQPLVEGLHQTYGSRDQMKIWIENVAILHQMGEIFIATYEEWQQIEGQITSRLSSVTFKASQDAPNGLIWMHLHETWIKN